MPTNLYGPGDNFDLTTSHVLPALIRKAHEAKTTGAPELVIWGTGSPRREFLHVDDCADAIVFLTKSYSDSPHVNIGSGHDMTICELAELVADIVGFTGRLRFDQTKPDGTPRKLMSSATLFNLGWSPKTELAVGISNAYKTYLEGVAGSAAATQTDRRS
jgi:GDP-L-fucose synthase